MSLDSVSGFGQGQNSRNWQSNLGFGLNRTTMNGQYSGESFPASACFNS